MIEWPKTAYKTVSKPIVSICLSARITSNQITLFNHFLTLTAGCYAFSRGTLIGDLCGLFICLINGFLDFLDGDLARETSGNSKLGVWLDSGFDVIVQNAIMGSIAIGCFKIGLPLIFIVLFLIGNAANNFVSFNYNKTFGFDSDKGNELFRKIMDRRSHPINMVLKNMIDPTSNYPSLMFYTYRYWITLGAIMNIMPFCFICMTIINNIKWFTMYVLYALYLRGEKGLFVLRALAMLDEESDEFYALRNSQ